MNSQQVIKPEVCALGFGIPTSHAAYQESLMDPKRRDFVPNRCSTWAKYYHFIGRHVEDTEPQFRTLGVTICHRLTSTAFASLLADGRTRVLIVFSHFSADAIEFHDGLKGSDEILSLVPPGFDGILDLCVCHPTRLVQRLRRERSQCLVKFTDHEATPSFWLHFYRILFRIVKEEQLSYLSALERTVALFINPH